MKVNELRVGNWIRFTYPSGSELAQCNVNTIKLVERGIDGIEPIFLTEGWLQDFGFEYWGHNIFAQAKFVLCNVIDGTSNFGVNSDGVKFYPVIDDDACCWSKFKYVHQLQNLYFALTGKELTL